jgi:hypothetical protein
VLLFLDDVTVNFEGGVGHGFGAELGGNGTSAGGAEGASTVGIQKEFFDGVGEGVGVAGGAEESATGGLDQFRERASAGLDDGDARGEGFDNVQTEGLAIQCGHGKNGERAEELLLFGTIEVRVKFNVADESGN